ncbi:MAG: terpene cyclase/mutase family protein [Planctomycetales bacterium]|nr:terpene cyclase/mutase family protein [Planctomycetales bacterium]MBN8625354.1 terpene cyclase/mutase family protein [Planctomycetota bacterium]
MEFGRNIRLVSTDGQRVAYSPVTLTMDEPEHQRLAAPLRRAIGRTRQWLLGEQASDGSWCAELEGDTILESEYILLLAFLGRHDSEIALKCARYILEKQNADGGWSQYPGGKLDVSISVKAYFALKLTGHEPSTAEMQRARKAILLAGGADSVNSFTRFYLALLGQISYDQCPAVPPEMMLLPKWFPINIYSMSAWSRTIVVPLAIMWAHRPVARLAPEEGIRELFLKRPEEWPPLRCPGLAAGTGLLSWDRFFRTVDNTFKFCEARNIKPLRKRALKQAEAWMVERFAGSDGLGAIFPPMVWSIIALRVLGYCDDSPEMRYCVERLEGLVIEEQKTARLQPCKSPVWDTAIALRSLSDAGLGSDHPAMREAIDWLLEKQIMRKGDWCETVDAPLGGGWCFEYENDFYPDVDDTAMVAMALATQYVPPSTALDPPELSLHRDGDLPPNFEEEQEAARLSRTTAALQRAERWLLAMQNLDGGWGAFDRDNDMELLCYVPFADHNAMIDPSTPDLAARVLEALGTLGRRLGDPAVDRAVAYLRKSQEADGSWFGRWGVNYIYGTWQVITGLRAVGMSPDDPMIVAGRQWLLCCQQPSGGWGESCDTYEDPRLRGTGNVTPSQTAWAVLGLIAAGLHHHEAVARGVKHLIETQKTDGSWDEADFTGTGFPRVFYLRYHYYRIYFPLMAMSRWAEAVGEHLETVEHAARGMMLEHPAVL